MTKETKNISVNLDEILRLTVDVTVSYLNNNTLPASEVPNFMHLIHSSLTKLSSNEKVEETQQLKPAVSIRKSITDKHLVCLEDGKQLKMLKRHLRTAYNLSRRNIGLSGIFPLTILWLRQGMLLSVQHLLKR